MNFADAARALAARCALLLGWQPAVFWQATPQELADILAALAPAADTAGPSPAQITQLMKDHPDEPN